MQHVFGTDRWWGVLNEITVWGLFEIPFRAQSFINERPGHELVDRSNNDNICSLYTKKKSHLTSTQSSY